MLSLGTLFSLAPPESAGWVRSRWLQPLSANAATAMSLPVLHRKESLTNRFIESMDKEVQSDGQIENQGESGEERRGGVEGGREGRERDYEQQDSRGTRREGRGDRILHRQLNAVFIPEC